MASSGSWGGYTVEPITGTETRDLVDGRFDLSRELAQEAYDKATEWLERLLTVDLLSSGIGDLITTWINARVVTYTWQDNPLLRVVPPDAPAAPNTQVVTMPTLPDDPGDYDSTKERYSSDLVTQLLSTLLVEIRDGSTGLSTSAEDDLYSRAIARRELEDEEARAKIIASSASLGWAKPPGSLAASLRRLDTERYRANQQIGYEIIINQAELMQKNHLAAIQAAVETEKSLMTYLLNSEEAGVRVYLAGIEAFKAKIQGILGKVEAQVAYNKGEIDIYSEMNKARAMIYDVLSRGVELEIKQAIANVDVLTKELDARIKMYTETYGVQKEVVKGAAQVAAQMCAAALGSVNVGAAIQFHEQRSDSTSKQDQKSDSYSESLNYNHNYSE